MKLILASASPRRSRLLGEAGADFAVHPSDAEEVFEPGLGWVENALKVALDKAAPVARRFPGSPVLAADTIVVLGQEMLGKPESENEAREMLGKLSGNTHEVITGMAIVHLDKNVRWSGHEVSRVTFGDMPVDWIAEYVSGGEPMDKAGAYAIQGGAGKWISGYEGSLTNIIGLPMEKLEKAFGDLGYDFIKENLPCR